MAPRKRLKLDPNRQPWEKQPGESTDMYMRFKCFMDLEDGRSLAQAMEFWNATTTDPRKQLTLGTIKQYSARYKWDERVQAWDAHRWESERRKFLKLRKEALERHRKQGIALQGKGAQALSQIPAAGLGPQDIVRMIVEGSRMELSALGEPTERVAHVGPTGGPIEVANYENWSPDQRDRYFRDLLSEMAHRTGAATGSDMDEDDQVI